MEWEMCFMNCDIPTIKDLLIVQVKEFIDLLPTQITKKHTRVSYVLKLIPLSS